jgi:hypothetical protein
MVAQRGHGLKQLFAISSRLWSFSQKLQSFLQEAVMPVPLNSVIHWRAAQSFVQFKLVRPAWLR